MRNLWDEFCAEHQILEASVPLFETSGQVVKTAAFGQNQRLLLCRSSEMESLVIQEVNKVLLDFHFGNTEYEGLIYMMFWRGEQQAIPLYIGKSEKYGKQGNNLSANIAQIASNKGKFCRWGDAYAYHIGDLSAAVCPDHPPEKASPKYKRWANRLFEDVPSTQPRLKQPTYFWIHAWKTGCIGVWKDLGATRLTSLEYHLITIASQLFPDSLLNEEGVNRK
jgi:hypothetical protein